MKPAFILPVLALVISNRALAQESHPAAMTSGMALHSPAEIKWKDGPPSLPSGAKIAILEGDPAKEGMFVMRVRLPDGYHVPAHTHPKPERVTVISGTFKLAMGDNPKLADARILPAGTYGVWPPGMVHAVWVEREIGRAHV